MDMSSLGWAFGGVIAANVLIATLSSWARAIVEVRRNYQSDRGWGLVAATSLFSSGPWALAVLGIFTYFEYSEPWAPWFFGGAGAWILYLGSVVAFFTWRQKRQKEKGNAA